MYTIQAWQIKSVQENADCDVATATAYLEAEEGDILNAVTAIKGDKAQAE